MKKKLASWNVNGIRACVKKGFVDWLKKEDADYVCLQETKFQHHVIDEMPEELKILTKYNQYYFSGLKKGYSGVAIFCKEKPLKVIEGLGIKKFDDEGRVITLEFKDFYLANAYFPNGQNENVRVPFKLEFCKKIHSFLKKLEKKKPVILCGDINTAHQAIDLKRPKQNEDTTGFLPIERAWVSKFIDDGFIDTFRIKNPETVDAFSWWSYRMNAREKNVGWRIDYFFVSSKLGKKIDKAYIQDKVLGSDHCPVVLTLK
ncbi:MAG: exodeoxyribonuclease III [Bacteriovoracaceae bacterium]